MSRYQNTGLQLKRWGFSFETRWQLRFSVLHPIRHNRQYIKKFVCFRNQQSLSAFTSCYLIPLILENLSRDVSKNTLYLLIHRKPHRQPKDSKHFGTPSFRVYVFQCKIFYLHRGFLIFENYFVQM